VTTKREFFDTVVWAGAALLRDKPAASDIEHLLNGVRTGCKLDHLMVWRAIEERADADRLHDKKVGRVKRFADSLNQGEKNAAA
jgi:hypothetical protein